MFLVLRSILNGHSFLSYTGDVFKCYPPPPVTSRNPIIFPLTQSTPVLHSWSPIPVQAHISQPDNCDLGGWNSRLPS